MNRTIRESIRFWKQGLLLIMAGSMFAGVCGTIFVAAPLFIIGVLVFGMSEHVLWELLKYSAILWLPYGVGMGYHAGKKSIEELESES